MDFKDQIKLLSERVIKLKENTQTEEADQNGVHYAVSSNPRIRCI